MVTGHQKYRLHGDSKEHLRVIKDLQLSKFYIPYALFMQDLFETVQGSC